MAKRQKLTRQQPASDTSEVPSDGAPDPAPVELELTWRGITLAVTYEPDYLNSAARGLGFAFSHLEVQVIAPTRAPLPITETGYRSHFTKPGSIEDAGGPAAYVEAWLNEAAKSSAWRRQEAAWRQLDLFS